MSRRKSGSLSWTLILCAVVSASAGQDSVTAEPGQSVTAEPGQSVTLPCGVPSEQSSRPVRWSRADLGDQYVLLYRNKQLDPEEQHPSFRNRVGLQVKDGDAALLLKEVTPADAGSYRCEVFVSSWALLSTVHLTVAPPPPPGPGGGATEDEEEGGSVGLIVGLSVAALLLLVAVVAAFVIYRKQRSQGSY